MAILLRPLVCLVINTNRLMSQKGDRDMSLFSSGQLNQLGDSLESADWTAEDITNLGQAGHLRLIEIRDSLRRSVRQAKTYLKRLFTFTLGAVKGNYTYETAREVFQGYFDPDFEKCGIVFSGAASETEIASDELVENGKFVDFLPTIASELEKRRVLGSQFLSVCRDNPDRLRGGGYANFFVLTKGDKPVEKDLSNVFVALVYVYDRGKLYAGLLRFQNSYVWNGDYGHRIFSPQQ